MSEVCISCIGFISNVEIYIYADPPVKPWLARSRRLYINRMVLILQGSVWCEYQQDVLHPEQHEAGRNLWHFMVTLQDVSQAYFPEKEGISMFLRFGAGIGATYRYNTET